MTDDPIVAEVRKARREILESHGWDYHKMLQDAMKRQQESGRPVAALGRKEPQQGVALDVYSAASRRFRRTSGHDADGPADGGYAGKVVDKPRCRWHRRLACGLVRGIATTCGKGPWSDTDSATVEA